MGAPSHSGWGRSGGRVEPELLYKLVGFPPEDLINILAPLLERLMERNEALPLNELTSFHARSRPPISVATYLGRFLQYAPMSNECYILLLIYLDRISQTNPAFCITPMNAHRMIVTGLVLAAKFSQDRYYTNTHYARVGGLPAQELKALELEFLARIFYTLWADPDIIEAYWVQLLQHAQRNNLLSEKARAFLQSETTVTALAAHESRPHDQLQAMQDTGDPPDPSSISVLNKPRLEPSLPVHPGQQNDEAMRYELLRRQQERLRHMAGAPPPSDGRAGTADPPQPGGLAPAEVQGAATDQSLPLVTSAQEPLIPTSHPYGSQDKFASSRFLPTQTSYQQQFNVPAFGQPQPRSQTAEHHPHGSHGDGVHSRHAGANVFKHPHKQAGNSPLYSPYPAQARPNPLTLTPHAAASGSLLPLPANGALLSPRSATCDASGIRSRSGSLESSESPTEQTSGPSPSTAHKSPCAGSSSACQSPAVLTPV